MNVQFLLFVNAILLFAIFWELCHINSKLKKTLPTQARTPGGNKLMTPLMRRLWIEDEAQDIAEYAVMLAVILVLVVGTIRLVGSNANNVFSSVASSIQ